MGPPVATITTTIHDPSSKRIGPPTTVASRRLYSEHQSSSSSSSPTFLHCRFRGADVIIPTTLLLLFLLYQTHSVVVAITVTIRLEHYGWFRIEFARRITRL